MRFLRYVTGLWAAAALLAGCGGSHPAVSQAGIPMVAQGVRMTAATDTRWPIAHLIVVIQQSRSFENLFAGYPDADAPTAGLTSTGRRVHLKVITLEHSGNCGDLSLGRYFSIAFRRGRMDGWNLLDPRDPLCPYTTVQRGDTLPYWTLAKEYTIADHMFSSTRFDEFVEGLYLIAGTGEIGSDTYIAGQPNNIPWGCDAPPGTRTPLYKRGRFDIDGPFPCFSQFRTMANLFDDARVSWKYYYSGPSSASFDAIRYVALGRDRLRNLSDPATNVLSDIARGHLSAVSWVLSPAADSDAPGTTEGPRWVNSIAGALKASRYWTHAAIVVVWADEGNGTFYDNVPPPQLDAVGLGFRVPMIVISPYAKRGHVAQAEYEFGSILKFIEENWRLPFLGGYATDRRANSIVDIFDFYH